MAAVPTKTRPNNLPATLYLVLAIRPVGVLVRDREAPFVNPTWRVVTKPRTIHARDYSHTRGSHAPPAQ
jgi:hypothetical protein